MVTKGETCGGRDKSGVWDEHTYTTIYKTTNKDLLYSTGNSTQYSVMAYMEKKLKKSEYMYMYNGFTSLYT